MKVGEHSQDSINSTNWMLLLLLSHFSRVWLCATPLDGSPPGSPVPGILQARISEWVAISFSNAWRWKVKVKSLSRVWLFVTPWTAAYQAPLSMGFSRQEYWSRVPLPSPNCVESASIENLVKDHHSLPTPTPLPPTHEMELLGKLNMSTA